MENLDFGPFGRRPLVHFAQDDKRENVILSVAKNLDNRGIENLTVFMMTSCGGMENLDFGPFGRRPLVHFAQDDKRENVILSVAKNLNNSGIEILRCTQNDKAMLRMTRQCSG